MVNEGKSHAAVAMALDRTPAAIAQQMQKHKIRSPNRHERITEEDALALAKAALVREIDKAKAERHRAPLYRHWPAGLWP